MTTVGVARRWCGWRANRRSAVLGLLALLLTEARRAAGPASAPTTAPQPKDLMGTVITHGVVSVDGFIADDNDDVGPYGGEKSHRHDVHQASSSGTSAGTFRSPDPTQSRHNYHDSMAS